MCKKWLVDQTCVSREGHTSSFMTTTHHLQITCGFTDSTPIINSQTSRKNPNTRYSSYDTLQPHFSPPPFYFSENRAKLSVFDSLLVQVPTQLVTKSERKAKQTVHISKKKAETDHNIPSRPTCIHNSKRVARSPSLPFPGSRSTCTQKGRIQDLQSRKHWSNIYNRPTHLLTLHIRVTEFRNACCLRDCLTTQLSRSED
jgi:hypothetical protein